MKNLFLFFTLFSTVVCGQSPYVSRIVEYLPAPGQFINDDDIGTPAAAESIVGGLNGLVSLGGFGGYITVGFDHTIANDPANPYGVDFTVAGNAVANSSEPGIVMVMADTNGNGLPDDTWYELRGSNHSQATTIRNYTITYKNPQSDVAADVAWTDSKGNSGVLKRVATHAQPYYPSPEKFPGYPQEEVRFAGTLIDLGIDETNPQYIRIAALPFGYVDNLPFNGNLPPFLPDNPQTAGVTEGNGGDAFDLDWAVDNDGNPVHLNGIDFIRIHTAVNVGAGWLGELSTEVRAVIDVAPDDVLSAPDWGNEPDVIVYPNPASDYVKIQAGGNQPITRVEIWNTSGKLVYINTKTNGNLWVVPVHDYPAGVYMVCVYKGPRKTVKKVIVN